MGDHLVDQDLEHQRHGKGDDAGQHRRDCDRLQVLLLTQDFRQEPPQSERLVLVVETLDLLAEDHRSRPVRAEGVEVHQLRAILLRLRIEDRDMAGPAAFDRI